MKKVFFVLFVCMIAFCGCAKPKRLTPEEEYRKRQERRMREYQHKRDGITSLSGLNDTELDILEKIKHDGDINPEPGSFVYSARGKNPHSSTRVLNELNEDGKKRTKEYQKSVNKKTRSGKDWVYGF